MTPPTEDEVRAWLSEQEAFLYGLSLSRTLTTDEHTRHALLKTTLALLDEARKDKERLEWVLSWLLDKHWTVGHLLGGDVAEMTTAIDQARGA